MDSEEAEQVKQQMIRNIESNFPKEKADALKKQILSMDDEQLEMFLKKSASDSECIFCSIASGKAQSYKIAENGSAVAVLEINPVSRGHVLVIPKGHLTRDKFPEEVMPFAEKIAKRIKEKLNPKDVEIASLDFQGHGVINLIPVYAGESIKSERYKAGRQELEEVSKTLTEEPAENKLKKENAPRQKKIKKFGTKKFWLPKRIP